MKLIDADRLKEYLDENWIPANHNAIDVQPTVDAEPVRHGKWIDTNYDAIVRCSECGRYYGKYESTQAVYCQKCGARMDG